MNMIKTTLACITLLLITALITAGQKSFGRKPRGQRLERILRSPNWKDGHFVNEKPSSRVFTDSGTSIWKEMSNKSRRPSKPLEMIREDLHNLPENDLIVWFGHSSFLLKISGKTILVDPVFYAGSPVSFINRAFDGTEAYRPEDMPDIDYLVITHDHWDHLDYRTVTELKDRVGKVVLPLGVGENFEYWGYDAERLIELDWYEDGRDDNDGFVFHCLPSRHFSGRGLRSGKALWASFLIETPHIKVYIQGDGGYDERFSRIARMYPDIDLAIMENGQYNKRWADIHMLPEQLGKAASEIGAKQIITGHHGKFSLSTHDWDEPMKNELEAAREYKLNLIVLKLGKIHFLARG